MSELFIFDFGNVLIKNITMIPEMARRLKTDEAALAADYALYEDSLISGLFPIEAYYRHLEDAYGVKIGEDLFRTCFHPVRNEGVFPVIDELRKGGNRVVVGSNTFHSHWHTIDELGISSHFDFCYASHLIHAVKPQESFFTYIMYMEGFTAGNTHFVDDMQENVDCASRLGIDAFRYTFNDSELRKHFGRYI